MQLSKFVTLLSRVVVVSGCTFIISIWHQHQITYFYRAFLRNKMAPMYEFQQYDPDRPRMVTSFKGNQKLIFQGYRYNIHHLKVSLRLFGLTNQMFFSKVLRRGVV